MSKAADAREIRERSAAVKEKALAILTANRAADLRSERAWMTFRGIGEMASAFCGWCKRSSYYSDSRCFHCGAPAA